jgi:ribosomal protein S18 acetylase RimI-like enzyme
VHGDADRDFVFAARRDGFKPYVEATFGPWVDDFQRPLCDNDLDELPFQIVELDGVAIGYACVVHAADHDFLDEIAMLPAYQGRGIGSALVRDMMIAAAARCVPLRLSVLEVNPAQRLYARLGFRVTRLEPPRVKMEWMPAPAV